MYGDQKRGLSKGRSHQDARTLKPELGQVFRADRNNGNQLNSGSLKRHDISKASRAGVSESTTIGTTFHGGRADTTMKHERKTEAGDIFERDEESAIEYSQHNLKRDGSGITDIIITNPDEPNKVSFKPTRKTKTDL